MDFSPDCDRPGTNWNLLQKRSDLSLEEVLGNVFNATEYNDYAKSAFPELDFELNGWLFKNDTRHGHLIPEGYSMWPVNSFTNHRGDRFHHMALPGFTNGHTRHRVGFANSASKVSSGLGKRNCDGCFKDEYFTEGGA